MRNRITFATGCPDVISVDAFGAQGDGTGNQAPAINSAIESSPVGSVIEFTAGSTYQVSDTIHLLPNRIYSGYGATIKLADNAATTLDLIETDLVAPVDICPMIIPSQGGGPHEGIKFFGFTLDGNGANQEEGYSYANLMDTNSIGMLIEDITSVDAAQDLNIANITLTDCSWTQTGFLLTDVSGGTAFTNAVAGMRILFTGGAGVDTTTKFQIVTVNSSTVVELNADINGAGGNIASGVTGAVLSCRAFTFMAYGNTATSKVSTNSVVSNSYFDNAGYDCVTARQASCTGLKITGCTILKGQQTAFQAYRAVNVCIDNCTIDNTGASGGAGGGVFLHGAKKCRISNSALISEGSTGPTYAAFGDAAVASNEAEDNVIDSCSLTCNSTTSGVGCTDFNGASAGYIYSRRNTISNCQLSVTDASGNHTCITFGTNVTDGSLTVSDCTMYSVSNEALINLGASRSIVLTGNRVLNTYNNVSFGAGRAMIISSAGATTPQDILINGNHFMNTDIDSPIVTIVGVNGVMFTNNVVGNLSSSVATGIGLLLDNADNSSVIGNMFYTGTNNAAGVISITNSPDSLLIMGNRFQRGRNNTTQPARGIGCTGGTYLEICNNDMRLCGTEAWGSTITVGNGSRVYGNMVDRSTSLTDSMNSGETGFAAAVITAAATTVTVTHNIVAARTIRASDIAVNLTNDTTNPIGSIWISGITSTQFVINCENVPGASTAIFAWSVDLMAAA